MAWITPITVATNDLLTAAQYNASVRDNFLEMAPAKATSSGNMFATSGTNQISERGVASHAISTSETTSATAYGDLATVGPFVTVNCAAALVFISARMSNVNEGAGAYASVAVSGATTIAASDDWMISIGGGALDNPIRIGTGTAFGLTAGSNTFTMKYKSQPGKTPSKFEQREIVVIGL